MTQFQPPGYLAAPSIHDGSGILVLHAWWGLNDTIKTFCDRLAGSGFFAFAPDLYHGQVAEDIAAAEVLGQALDSRYQQARSEIADATGFLLQHSGQEDHGVAVIGFSLGAFYALDLANSHPESVHSVVLFYGTGGGDWTSSKADYLGHFAGQDEYEPPAGVDELEETLRSAGRKVTFYRYPGTGHWFFEPDVTQAYDPDAASLAWERTLAFLRRSDMKRT
jgi:carboxymethylenebutenolidase